MKKQNGFSQKGQVAVEYILLMVVITAIIISTKNILVSNNTLALFIQKPWDVVSGMIETGVWGEAKKVRSQHPGSFNRHNSFKGDPD